MAQKFINLFFSMILLIGMVVVWTACSDDETYFKLNGEWEGENTNGATSKKWPFTVYLDHRGRDLSGIYTDFRGSRTLRTVLYDGEEISFVVDIWPETATFVGIVRSDSSMDGTWSFSADGNNGEWYLYKDRDPDDEDDDDDEDEDDEANHSVPAGTSDPFSSQ
ncbi:hypothetical protein JXA80_12900 [bacterium]|nr:hypothetical protein [candidate division CSSED10-310 bacterium]